ncbi:MAG: PRC-barrel domain-containing protein [Steroidobacteraceae bacterium]
MIKLQTLGLAIALGLAGAALAQTPSPSTTTNPDPQSRTSESSTGTPPISGSDTTSSSGRSETSGTAQTTPSAGDEDTESTRVAAATDMKSKDDMHRASKLIGKNVETSTGDTIGEVKDLVIDQQGKITHVIISYGRLGSTKLTAVPHETVKQMKRGDKIVVDRTRLENAPSFEESNYPNLASASWSTAADRYWGRSRTASARQPDPFMAEAMRIPE